MKVGNKKKVGRNDPCPCGSGQKYKRCHGNLSAPSFQIPQEKIQEEVNKRIAQIQAKEKQRQEQQGLGRPIISTIFQDKRVVAVGNKVFYGNWKTVLDFLSHYIKETLGTIWGNAELAKPLNERHPTLVWYHHLCMLQEKHFIGNSDIYNAPMTGAAAAWFQLAYDLYCLEHNAELQAKLIQRIKDNDLGARYEAFVAACFIRGGFDIKFEDESNRNSTHVEFTATCHKSKLKYSVEAKHRHASDNMETGLGKFRLGRRLQKALKKDANHPRVVFIDLNVPDTATGETMPRYLETARNDIRKFEGRSGANGQPLPSAYVLITNQPYEYNLEGTQIRSAVLAEGFQIPEFKFDRGFASALDAHRSRKAHSDMHQLLNSIHDYTQVPTTFDGEAPELAYGEHPTRLVVGEYYEVPNAQGEELPAKLTGGAVIPEQSLAWGIYQFDNGESVICKNPLSEAEVLAYKRHPETFFGVVQSVGGAVNTPLEMFDFLLNTYKDTPKDKLLDFMASHADIEHLKILSQEELAEIYCNRMTSVTFHQVSLKDQN